MKVKAPFEISLDGPLWPDPMNPWPYRVIVWSHQIYRDWCHRIKWGYVPEYIGRVEGGQTLRPH